MACCGNYSLSFCAFHCSPAIWAVAVLLCVSSKAAEALPARPVDRQPPVRCRPHPDTAAQRLADLLEKPTFVGHLIEALDGIHHIER